MAPSVSNGHVPNDVTWPYGRRAGPLAAWQRLRPTSAFCSLFTRDSIYSIARICHADSVRPSVRLSVTGVFCINTAGNIIEILSLFDRPVILVFRHQGSLRKSDCFTPKRGHWIQGGSDFRPICGYSSETVIDTNIFIIEDEYKVVCAL